MSGKAAPLSADDLAKAFDSDQWIVRWDAVDRYRKHKVAADSIPLLRRALRESYHGTVKAAAMALRKLGPVAKDAVEDLLSAATVTELGMPQAYPECVRALAAIDPQNPELFRIIQQHIGLRHWLPLKASLEALKAIGTPEALAFLRASIKSWEAELTPAQKRFTAELIRH